MDGSTVSYDSAPALTQEQLQKQVGTLLAKSNNVEIQSVSCQSGLEGVEGKTADCTVGTSGDTLDVVATVTKVDGLSMNFSIDPA